jgi:pyridoxamine 5'-phosphate oxidase
LDGRPHARIVLLKGLTGEGLFFYTNYESAKAVEMDSNPAVAALFFWPLLERQVRIEGEVRKITPAESDHYFSERPRESQIGAWASPQSQVVESTEVLGQLYAKAEQRFEGQPVPRPPFWGGYCILPVSFEFWQGQPARMHHRFKYHQEKGMWQVDQLAP